MRIPFYFFAAILCFHCFAAFPQVKENCLEGRRHHRATIRHIESGGIGYGLGYTTLEAFLASDPNQWRVTPFLDVRGHVFDNGKWAANAGVGFRTLWTNRVYGLNMYYDYRNAGRLHSNQVGIGLETLGPRFDVRVNGYFPVGAKTSSPYDVAFGNFSGHYLLLSQKYQSAMKGADAEWGVHFGRSQTMDFYAAAGPYYFVGEVAPATWGGKARVSGTFKDILTLEISNSYDGTFHNRFQGQIGFRFSFGPKSKVKKHHRTCKEANILYDRMLQPVGRQEIIVIDNTRKNTPAIDPATGLPFFFVFVDNTSSSDGTYESPYPTLEQAQDNSSPRNIIYVFPGDGTTTGMDAGITLKAYQKFWGSGVNHLLQTTEGGILIPAQSSTSPEITNTDVDTDGNAINLASNNSISGIDIVSALNDAIYGTDAQNLEVSFCRIEDTTTFAIEATFLGNATISITNNRFLSNVNGVALTLNGTSTLVCSNNTFVSQSSVSNVPLEIAANDNTFTAHIENNLFDDNTTGSVRFNLHNVVDADILLLNNTVTNNGTGSQATLGSSIVMIADGTTAHCALELEGNTFSANTSNALYLHTSGAFTTLEATLVENTIADSLGGGFVFATPTTGTFTLVATDNSISECDDNAIAVISAGSTTTGDITISNNSISQIGNASNGIAINQNFSTLDLVISNNTIRDCEGTGIISYAPTGIDSLTLTISGNTIRDCDNDASNAASGIDIEQYSNFLGFITNNTLIDNAGIAVVVGSTLSTPSACLTLTGNDSNTNYLLINPVDGTFNLSPLDADLVNVGTITTSGVITLVESCPTAGSCSP